MSQTDPEQYEQNGHNTEVYSQPEVYSKHLRWRFSQKDITAENF